MWLSWFMFACQVDNGQVDLQYCQDDLGRDVTPSPESVTWHQDAAPIVAAKCGGCHGSEGLAPFTLNGPEDFAIRAETVRLSLESGSMPPWSAEACCGQTYLTDRSLTDDELATLLAWLDQGTPEGDPDTASDLPPPASDLPRVDATITMSEAYTAEPQRGTNDDLRCFLVDLPTEATGRYVVGQAVVPGNTDIVHHVVVDAVPPEDLADYQALDDEDAGPGWNCFGGGGATGGTNIGGWVPGQGGFELPGGLGRWIEEGSQVVLGMHYDLSATGGEPATDQTSVQLMLADEVDQVVESIALIHPLWLLDDGMAIPGGGAETSYALTTDPGELYGRDKRWEVWGVFAHMHELGASTSIAIHRADGTQECLLHIADWDFAWQADYWFDAPTALEPDDALYLECTWVNPGDDMAWQTDQEMCVAALYVTEIPE